MKALFRICILLFCTLATGGRALAAEERPAPPETLQEVAQSIQAWDGMDVGRVFWDVKALNPGKGAIISMREMKKAVEDKKLSIPPVEWKAIEAKMLDAQAMVKDKIIAQRKAALKEFFDDQPDLARKLSSFGDVGSWPFGADINSDVDYTVFGDSKAAAPFVDQNVNPMLLEDIDGPGSKLSLKDDLDIVVTPEGREKEAGVFETEGGEYTFSQCPAVWGRPAPRQGLISHWTLTRHPAGTVPQYATPIPSRRPVLMSGMTREYGLSHKAH